MNTNEGFRIEFIETLDNYKINPLGIISLKRAMVSFFSTYEGIHRNVIIRDSDDNNNSQYPAMYFEYYIDCIVFFQHFFELTIKDLLAHDSELLITTYKNKDSIEPLYDLIHKIDTNTDGVNSVEFSDALDRIKKLVTKIYPDGSFDFIKQKYNALKKLNKYRNMAVHRGRFILKFEELDNFIGKEIFPIIQDIFNHPYYKGLDKKWRYPLLHCGIDPFEEIIKECKKPETNHKKIALLKELGRAAYNQTSKNKKLWIYSKGQKNLIKQKILASAQFEIPIPKEYLHDYMDICPVCGEKSIISFKDSNDEYDIDEETGEQIISEHIEWVGAIKCVWCSYELDCSYIGDISQFGLTGLHNYFK
ncbi:hypothetical protein CLRAG_03410 [Clostridium ragsdalei P11]|uniref:Uncharacterized protein n=1 Tax=Clostridium ragsdalei P11 TaxID=1353534 RepID=A0A1A6B3F6_9CLOT|nr:hypothetical protein [Clostridium ragsdalei]OBR96832.1 hypothetical protein CLRAG_03410 [Clostridium ragsdalei P11]